jgi:hypothetical protein
MAADPWTSENYKTAARSTGKPFEVQVASIFKEHRWRPLLGTYYTDVTTDSVREVDVVASLWDHAPTKKNHSVEVRAYVSCRGFSNDERLVTYSLPGKASAYAIRPHFLYQYSACEKNYGTHAAELVVQRILGGQSPIASFDIYAPTPNGTLKPKGDARLRGGQEGPYSALESALKAAAFWYELYETTALHCIHVPIVVVPRAWMDIGLLEEGNCAEPQERTRGFALTYYPLYGRREHPQELMSIVTTVEDLPLVISELEGMYATFVRDIDNDYGVPGQSS